MKQKSSTFYLMFCLLLTIIATSIIVWFLPREKTVSYDYTIGKPWRYGKIIAEYDFPIYKSNEAIQIERDSVRKAFRPYYTINAQEGDIHIQHFKTDLVSGKIPPLPANYVNHIEQKLRDIYQQGILDNDDYTALKDSNITAINIISGTSAQTEKIANFHTIRSAYLAITETDTINFKHNILIGCNLNEYLSANMQLDRGRSKTAFTDLLSSISYASGMVQSGQKIIDRGDIVTAKTISILESMKKESIKRHNDNDQNFILTGQIVYVLTLFIMLIIYMSMYRKDYLQTPKTLTLLFFLLTLFACVTSFVEYSTFRSAYLIPYAMIPIFVRVFLDARTAFVATIVSILLCSASVHGPYEFTIVQMLAGTTCIFSIKEMSSRSQIFQVAILTTLTALLVMLAYDLSQGHTLKNLDPSWYTCLCVSGIFLLFAYPIMYLIEKTFGFTSSVTLIELSNVNMPLLRRMSKEAQGTFNHSMQVANLATEVSARIGAKVELVRTGAMYHDIGKMKNPAFFTENQSGINPHQNLTEERSAQIIIQHVLDGMEMADNYHLPSVIKAFISTHHGRGKTKYFYINYRNKHPEEPINEEMFTYPGPNPSTKEQAILMMADSVEAASRSLKEINDDTLRILVNDIVNEQMNAGYFQNCPITFNDIEIAKEQFTASLKTIYHTRISYPSLVDKSQESEESSFFGKSWSHSHKVRKQHISREHTHQES